MSSPDALRVRLNDSLAGAEAAIPRVPAPDLARLTLLLLGIMVVSLAGLLGGMQYVIAGLSLGLALLVVRKPEEAVPAGLLFMLAAMVLLPSQARFRFIDPRFDQAWQMYFWAAGSLIIVLAAF